MTAACGESATRSRQREHQLGLNALPQGVVTDQTLELADQLRILPEREVGINSLLARRQALLLKPCGLSLCANGSSNARCLAPKHEQPAAVDGLQRP